MGRFAALLVVGGLAGATMATPAGCTTPVALSEGTGNGGGTGGARPRDGGHTGGAAAFDGSADGPPFGLGTGGAGTTCLNQTDGGAIADAAAADAHATSDGGVCFTLPPDPRVFPWIFEPRGSSATVDASASGCQLNVVSGQLVDVVCSGPAFLRADGGLTDAGASAPSIVWDDKSVLSWSPMANASIAAPIAAGASPQRVWAAMESHGWLSVPGQCGWTWNQTMEVRDSAGGPIRFMAREGASLPELTSEESMALFGTSTAPVAACTHDVMGGPGLFHQTLNDHVLGMGNPQRIPYAQPTNVATPNGTFAVVWYSRTQHAQASSTSCAGCLNQGPIVGLLASRVLAP